MVKIFMVVLFGFLVCGCEALKGGCITVGGEWNGKKGELTYCLDKAKTTTEGRPVLDGDGQKLTAFTDGDLQKIADLIAPSEVGAKSTETACQRIVKKLKE